MSTVSTSLVRHHTRARWPRRRTTRDGQGALLLVGGEVLGAEVEVESFWGDVVGQSAPGGGWVVERGEMRLQRGQVVKCQVTGHRGHFGVEVKVIDPPIDVEAFIDFILLVEVGVQVSPQDFPPVGTVLTAVFVATMPWGEHRLSARASSIAQSDVEGDAAV